MERQDQIYKQYLQILKEELIPAMGCTEPIAIAYLASYARDILGCLPDKVNISVSGNLLKNVKSVVVPNTGGMKGIEAAVSAGLVAGQSDKQLEVIASVSEEQVKEIQAYCQNHEINVDLLDTKYIFDMVITLIKGDDVVKARIVNYHTNIVYASKNNQVILDTGVQELKEDVCDKSCLNIADIVKFADIVDIEDVKPILDVQINFNMTIAEEGLKNNYGANIGKTLLKTYGNNTATRCKAYAAAASDARMNGCELPVIIVSGSGNQGITASVPVIVYARDKGFSQEELYRALCVSDLCTIHQKSGIGRLSAYCGAVSAGIGSGAGIAYLETHSYEAVAHTIVNGLGMISGTICDGAKASCAAKIQSAIDAGLLAFNMYLSHQEFKNGEGLTDNGVESTIKNVGRLAKEGMKETDKEIIAMMIKKC